MSMTVIEHIEVGSGGVASITFTSGGNWTAYTDLLLVCSFKSTTTSSYNGVLRINGTTGTNYTQRVLLGNGSSPDTASATSLDYFRYFYQSLSSDSGFGNAQFYLPNINSSAYKSISADSVSENNGTTAYAAIAAGLFPDTSAITSLQIGIVSGNIAEYSSATLYGITAGSDGTTTVS